MDYLRHIWACAQKQQAFWPRRADLVLGLAAFYNFSHGGYWDSSSPATFNRLQRPRNFGHTTFDSSPTSSSGSHPKWALGTHYVRPLRPALYHGLTVIGFFLTSPSVTRQRLLEPLCHNKMCRRGGRVHLNLLVVYRFGLAKWRGVLSLFSFKIHSITYIQEFKN